MKLHTCTLFVLLAMGSASLQAQLPCREDAYGNYICDELKADPDLYPEEEEEEYETGVPTGIPGIATPRPTVRQAAPFDRANAPVAPILVDSDDPGDRDGEDDDGVVYDVTDDGLGNFKARTRDGRVLFGLPDPYGEMSWRDKFGNPVDCAFDSSGRLVCP